MGKLKTAGLSLGAVASAAVVYYLSDISSAKPVFASNGAAWR